MGSGPCSTAARSPTKRTREVAREKRSQGRQQKTSAEFCKEDKTVQGEGRVLTLFPGTEKQLTRERFSQRTPKQMNKGALADPLWRSKVQAQFRVSMQELVCELPVWRGIFYARYLQTAMYSPTKWPNSASKTSNCESATSAKAG